MSAPVGYREFMRGHEERAKRAALHQKECAQCQLYHPCKQMKYLVRKMEEHTQEHVREEWFAWAVELKPRVLPIGWSEIQPSLGGGVWEYGERLRVITSGGWEKDDRRWLHVSVSVLGQRWLPTWEEMSRVKELFIGRDQYAYSIFPPASQYINLGEVLHLWACCEPDYQPLPEFSADGVTV
jgi:hypothetical protein